MSLDVLRALSIECVDPGAVALQAAEGVPCSYGALARTLNRAEEAVRPWLESCAETPRVLSLLPNAPGSALGVLALLRGAAVAPVNPALSDAELRSFADRYAPHAVLARPDRPDDLSRVADLGLPTLQLDVGRNEHCADFDFVAPDGAIPSSARSETGALRPGLVLSTSGSTGTPKLVPLASTQLTGSARNIADWLRLSVSDRALHMLPMFHIGAFVDLVLAPLAAGGSVHFGHPITTERIVSAVIDAEPTWIQLVPTMLHHLLEQDDPRLGAAARRLRFVRTVSADLAPALQARAHELFGDTPIIQMYGMTETAGQITSNPLPPDEARAGSVGLPAGPLVKVMDAHANPRPTGDVGEICVSGPTVMSGYLDHDGSDAFHGEWLRTGDLGYLDRDGFLTITGRLKEMINRGGEKISPVEIERALLSHPDVLEAVAFGAPHPTLGEEAMAAVVTTAGREFDREALDRHVAELLADFKRPRRVVALDGLPRLGSGKIDRVALRSLVAGVNGAAPPPERPLTPLGRTLSRLWVDTLGSEAPRPDSDFFDDGGDSLTATTFVTRVERAVGATLPANLLFEAPTFEKLEERVAALPKRAAPSDPLVDALRRGTAAWSGVRAGPRELLVGRRTVGSKPPFFFVTRGLTGAEDLISAFDPDRPVYVMRPLSKLTGRFGIRLQTETNKRKLARIYRDEIEAVHPTGPVFLGGFCQGADVARLVAAELRASGREVGLLAVIDQVFAEPVEGRVAIAWTAGSSHSGDTQFRDSERHLDLLYPDGCAVLHLPIGHADAIEGPAARNIADFFEEQFVAEPDGAGHHDPTTAIAARRAAHSARIRLSAPRLAAPGEALQVRALVTNTSPVTWTGTDSEGLGAYARWLNLDGYVRTPRAGAVALERRVEPGETVALDLEVPYPDRRLPMILMVDMVDDGLNWFHAVGSRAAYRLVWPYPFVRRSGSDSNQR